MRNLFSAVVAALLLATTTLLLGTIGAQAQTGCTQQNQTALLNSLADNVAAGSITPQTLRNVVCSTLSVQIPLGQIYVGNSSGVGTAVTPSGDLTMSGTGVFTLGASGVTPGSYGSGAAVPVLTIDAKGRVTGASTTAIAGGTVTAMSIVPANGLTGSVANATTTPALTLGTTVNGIAKGNGTGFSAATAGTDYLAPSGLGSGVQTALAAATNVNGGIYVYGSDTSALPVTPVGGTQTTLAAGLAAAGLQQITLQAPVGSTVTIANTFQTALAANASRKSCLIQNTSTHTLLVYIGPAGSASSAAALPISPGGAFNCTSPGGDVLGNEISVTTSTTGDTFVAVFG